MVGPGFLHTIDFLERVLDRSATALSSHPFDFKLDLLQVLRYQRNRNSQNARHRCHECSSIHEQLPLSSTQSFTDFILVV
jgi:hypothetical protein